MLTKRDKCVIIFMLDVILINVCLTKSLGNIMLLVISQEVIYEKEAEENVQICKYGRC